MDRRAFLSALALGALGGCAAAPPETLSWHPRRTLAPLSEDPTSSPPNIPIVDFHTHLQRRVTAERLAQLQDQARVSRMVLMPLYYGDRPGFSINDGEGSDEQAAEYARRYPDRFMPFVGMQRSELGNAAVWGGRTPNGALLLRETEAKLRSGEFFGMGEFMLRFYPYTNRWGIVAPSEMRYPPFSYLMRQFADLSARYRAPMVIHCEAEPEYAEEMRRLAEAHPEATLVWAHNCGRSSAEVITAMLERFPNLHADLGGMVYSGPQAQAYGQYWPRRTPWMHLVVDEFGILAPDMRAMFERFSDRFVIGTDIAHARVYDAYAGHWPRWRSFLLQISPAAAHRIAYQNAERFFRPASLSSPGATPTRFPPSTPALTLSSTGASLPPSVAEASVDRNGC